MDERNAGDEKGPKSVGREAPAGRKSGTSAPPVIAVRMEALLGWVVLRVAKFPREHKFTIGDWLVEPVARRGTRTGSSAAGTSTMVRGVRPRVVRPSTGITPRTDAVILRCLAKEPGERFADASALALAIASA